MIYRTLIFLVSIYFLSISSQAQNFSWAKKIGGSGYDRSWRTTESIDGSIYLSAVFSDTLSSLSGNNRKVSRGLTDAMVVKYSPNGLVSWVYQIGGVGSEYAYEIQTDINGNVYVVGIFSDSVDFDEGVGIASYGSANTGYDIFILKLDSSGSFLWVKTIINSGDERGLGLALGVNGELFVCGMFSGTVDLDPGPATDIKVSSGNMDVFFLKLDHNGAYQWGHALGASQSDRCQSISLDSVGNCVITGNFYGSVDFDPSAGANWLISVSNSSDIFLAKYDSSGHHLWAKSFGWSEFDAAYDLNIDYQDNIIITGGFQKTVNFNPGGATTNLTSVGLGDIFIAKFTTNGANHWAVSVGDTLVDQGFSVDTDIDGNVYGVGYFSGTPDFNPGQGVKSVNSKGGRDGYMIKLDSQGAYKWALQIGSAGEDRAYGVMVSRKKDVYVSGDFEDTVSFFVDTLVYTLIEEGQTDAFIEKVSQCNLPITKDTLVACDSVISPSGFFVWDSSGVYMDTLQSRIGCDSIIMTSLTVTKSTFERVNVRSCNSYNSPSGKTWSNTGSYLDTIMNSKQCDSLITINLTIDTTTFGVLNTRSCYSFNAPSGSTYISSGVFIDTITNTKTCDSVLTINLIIDTTTFSSLQVRSCYSFTSASGKVWTSTGQYSDTIVNSNGCDSIISYDIIVDSTTYNNISGSYCFEYISPSGKRINTSGQYTDTVFNSKGCDSVVFLDIYIDTVNTNITQEGHVLKSEADSGIYQWMFCDNSILAGAADIVYEAKLNGAYKVEIQQKGCIDTSDCYVVSSVSMAKREWGTVKIYPNPTKGDIYIYMQEPNKYESYELRSISGALLNAGLITKSKTKLEVSSISGMFFLSLMSVNGETTQFRIVNIE